MGAYLTYVMRLVVAVVLGGTGVSMAIGAAAVADARAVLVTLAAGLLVGAWLLWPRRPNAWRSDPPTQRQLEYAADLGIQVPRRATKGQVSDLISQATGR